MTDLRNVVITSYTIVKDDAGLSGKLIGRIYGDFQPFDCVVDHAELHDGDVPMVDPATWKETGKQGWVEWTHCIEHSQGSDEKYLVTRKADGTATIQRIG